MTPAETVFFEHLKDLHLQAGAPSSRRIAAQAGGISHTTVNNLLTGRVTPRWEYVQAIVQALEGDEEMFHRFWMDARRSIDACVARDTPPARGQVDNQPILPGDQVLIRAEVIVSHEGVGALVKLHSKTDEYQAWVAERHLQQAVLDSVPDEPDDGTWLAVPDSEGFTNIFHRDDAEGPRDERRRHEQHWRDIVRQEWIDWPEAVHRGAGRPGTRRMTAQEPS